MSAVSTERRTPEAPSAGAALRAVAGSPRLPWIVLAAVMAGAAAATMHAGRGTTFFYDDWPVILERRDWTLDTLLRPHVDHLQVFPTLAYKLMLETIGMQAHWAYRALLAALNILTGVLLFMYARKRVSPWIALGLAACLVLMADSWYNLLYSFQINFVGAMAAGVGMLLALDRRDRLGDVLASALLLISIGCNSVALPFAVVALVEVLWRADRWKRIWIPGVPLVLYGIWRLAYGDQMSTETRWLNVESVPSWIMDGLDESTGAILGAAPEYSATLAVLLVGFVAYVATRPGRFTPRLAALIAMPLVFWILSALSRANQGIQADENRYLYASGLMLALVLVEAARHHPLSRRVAGALAGLLLFGAAASAKDLEGSGERLRMFSITGKDAATAYDIAGTLAPYDLGNADPTQPFLKAGPYREAVGDYGPSPGFTREELLRQDPPRKLGVDESLTRVHQIGVDTVAEDTPVGTPAPKILGGEGGHTAAADRGCLRYEPVQEGAFFVVELPWTGVLVRAGDAPAEVRLHRFSTLWPEAALGEVAAGGAARVEPAGRDTAPEPFAAQVKSTAPFDVCTDR